MRKTLLIALVLLATAFSANAQEKNAESKVKHLTYKEFLKNVWDIEKNTDAYVFKGKTPAIIDFYADWCGPCRMVAPIIEKLAQEYDGKLDIYKVNVDQERELAAAFQVRSIPTVLFLPVTGQPMIQAGALSEELYRKVIEERVIQTENAKAPNEVKQAN